MIEPDAGFRAALVLRRKHPVGVSKRTTGRQKLSWAKKPYALDPRFAAARTWDWRLCLDCGTLDCERCPSCGGGRFTKRPAEIMRVPTASMSPRRHYSRHDQEGAGDH
jgi:hypothetical protein